MTSKWFQGATAARAIEEFSERVDGRLFSLIDTFDIAWSAWECDSQGALIVVDGEPLLLAADQTIAAERFEIEIVDQLQEYRRLIGETERVLARYRQLRGEPAPVPFDDRKAPLERVLYAMVAEVVETSDLARLAQFTDRVWESATPPNGNDTAVQDGALEAIRAADGHLRAERQQAAIVEEARKRRPDESYDDYAGRMARFGLDDGEKS